jgi:pimeloyl-ACP methyl ester carboxylesterase
VTIDHEGMWTEEPLFIPYEGHHLGAILTSPASTPRGMVLLMTGYGAPRSHRFQMWTRAARRLAAEHNLAVLRYEFVGMGDSTGTVLRWGWREGIEATAQGLAAAEVGLGMLGVDRYVAAGNCIGAAVALGLAAQRPECIGGAAWLMHVFLPRNPSDLTRKLRTSKAASLIRKNRVLKQRISQKLQGWASSTPPEFEQALVHGLDKAELMFVYGENDFAWSPQVKAEFQRIVSRLPADARSRFNLRIVPGERLSGFESIHQQDMTIDTLVRWTSDVFRSDSGDTDGSLEDRTLQPRMGPDRIQDLGRGA